MRSIDACRGCGRLFPFLPRGLCAGCSDAREEDFRRVRGWLGDHRGASIAEVAEATGVGEGRIVSFIREGRLECVDPGVEELGRRRGEPLGAPAPRPGSDPGGPGARTAGMRTRGR